MLRSMFPLCLMLILMTGCRSTPAQIDTACSWVKPITTNKADRAVMARGLKEQILTHNDMWDLKCGNQGGQ